MKLTNSVVLLLMASYLAGCGPTESDSSTPAVREPVIVYDESVNGPLPYSFSGLSNDDIARYTFTLNEGVYIVKGSSTTGETFALNIPAGLYLKTIAVSFYTHIDLNDKIIAIDHPTLFQVLWDLHHLPTIGTYNYSIDVPSTNIGNGVFRVYSGTSVQGASNENPFTISFQIVRSP